MPQYRVIIIGFCVSVVLAVLFWTCILWCDKARADTTKVGDSTLWYNNVLWYDTVRYDTVYDWTQDPQYDWAKDPDYEWFAQAVKKWARSASREKAYVDSINTQRIVSIFDSLIVARGCRCKLPETRRVKVWIGDSLSSYYYKDGDSVSLQPPRTKRQAYIENLDRIYGKGGWEWEYTTTGRIIRWTEPIPKDWNDPKWDEIEE